MCADWHRIDIVAALHKRGVTMRGLSEDAGLKPDTLQNVLHRLYPKGERIIANALDMEPASKAAGLFRPFLFISKKMQIALYPDCAKIDGCIYNR